MNVDRYLERIGLSGSDLRPTVENLRAFQKSHLLNVPFENLDIHWGSPIVLDVDRFYDKIVNQQRGGYCYELNGLFNELLTAIGFETRLVSARVFSGTEHGPEFDHAAIVVTLGEKEFLADVGFGDFTTEPLRFEVGLEQTDAAGTFIFRQFDNEYYDVAKRDVDGWKSEYIFKPAARTLSEFTEMNDFQQSSPESHFRKGKICSLLTRDGRKTLSDKKYIVTTAGEKTESVVASEAEFDAILASEFNISQNL